MMQENLIQAALDAANEIRALMGRKPVKKLRKGERYHSYSCPIARTADLGKRVGISYNTHTGRLHVTYFYKDKWHDTIIRNARAARFALAFDTSEFSALVTH